MTKDSRCELQVESEASRLRSPPKMRRKSKTLSEQTLAQSRKAPIPKRDMLRVIDETRPRTRADCELAERPCFRVTCRYNLYLDVNPQTGSVKFNFPDKQIEEIGETCVLDVANRGGVTLNEAGALLNITRERVRQLELSALRKMRQFKETRRHAQDFWSDWLES